jgi:hypothetical protein
MAGKPTPVTTDEIQEFASRLRKLANVCDVAITQMASSQQTRVYVSGHATAELSYERIHSFVNNVIGESFNPSPEPSTAKAVVDAKLAEADAILNKLKKTPPKRKN